MQILINLLQTGNMRRSLRKRPSCVPRAFGAHAVDLWASPASNLYWKTCTKIFQTAMYVCYVRKRRAFHEGVGPRIESVDYFGTREYFSRRKNKESLG